MPTALLWNRSMKDPMPELSRIHIIYDYDEDNHNALTMRQDKMLQNNDPFIEPLIMSVGSTVAV